jgi:hypothetical protein
VEQLQQRLTAQGERLMSLASRLRESAPALGGTTPTGLADLDEALRRGWDALGHADAEARQAEERAQQPTLLPGLPETGRNVLVYSAAALLATLASCGLWQAADTTGGKIPLSLVPWQLCGLPAMAFFAGYIVLVVVGRPRIDSGRKVNRSAVLGGVICFVGIWLAWGCLIAATRG